MEDIIFYRMEVEKELKNKPELLIEQRKVWAIQDAGNSIANAIRSKRTGFFF